MDIIQPKQKVLSTHEFEVLKHVACGSNNQEIAIALKIKERTVRFHVENILDKLEVKNRAEARCYACKNGWITD